MSGLPHTLTRTIRIGAPPALVFRFFTDSERWARWWGSGSTIEAKPGGRVYIRHPNGIESAGEVLELRPPERIVFTYGFVQGEPIPSGASRVTITLEPEGGGTRLRLEHAFQEAHASARDAHVQGWRFQLSLFANVASDEVNRGAAELVDRWFSAWSEPDAALREATLADICAPDVRMRDRYSHLEGLADLLAHVEAAQRFMPGLRTRRSGEVRHCQGVLLVPWSATGADGAPRGSGSNVFVCGPDGRLEAVTGFWD